MAFVCRDVLRRSVSLLLFVLLCLLILILYTQWSYWSSNRRNSEHQSLSFSYKQVIERIRHETAGGGGAAGGGEARGAGGAGGSGADKGQFLKEGEGGGGEEEGEDRGDKGQFQFLNGVMKSLDMEAVATMQRNASSVDKELIDIVRRLMNPPPTEGSMALVYGGGHTLQSQEVDALLNEKRNGFFIECGAFDGESTSNSLPFEQNRGWTGILIEANPYYYMQMLGKNRKAWTLNACLSPYNYATQLEFELGQGQLGRVMLPDDLPHPSSSSGDQNKKRKTYTVPCFPLETILLALNRTHVDYFSLDVEGLELEVLKTIPFDRIDIHVLTVEYTHGRSGKDAYKSFMESQGFWTVKEVTGPHASDYLFIKQ